MKRAIRNITFALPTIEGAYGFGSYFRSEVFSDVDVLIVLGGHSTERLRTFAHLREKFAELELELGVSFDLTILTPREFSERPLREMNSLVALVDPDEPA